MRAAVTARRHVLALDQGTTGSTALVVDPDGDVRGRGYAELPQHFPRPGWVEHDPEEIWQSTVEALGAALQAARVSPSEIAAVGITNQRETAIVWDRGSGRPIHRAIVWQCRRTAPLCERLKADGAEPEFRARTGLVLDPYFSGTKIRWLLDEVDGARSAAERGRLAFGTVDSWLLWRLTGGAVHATDPSNASRTLCFDIHALAWDAGLCRRLGIPTAVLPEVKPSAGIFGETAAGALPAGIPVAGIAGDQQAALFGQAAVEPGMAKNTYGTGLLRAPQHRGSADRFGARAARDGGVDGGRAHQLRPRGQRVRRRRRRAVAARRAGRHRQGRRDARARGVRCLTRAGCTSSRPSSGWGRPTGIRTRAAS